jgi:hypothetical protein
VVEDDPFFLWMQTLNAYLTNPEETMKVDRSKIIAIVTGAISLLLGLVYLVLVQILDFRGEMVPAPLGTLFGGRGLL